ncbi:hypothetical protein K432DRAFT_392724 [Lepidopterella palustris CBS 459.81]|uniref:Uncharacterized protein n=1 Tax=Lepidopterella palustris CBS 459.81 TaxID=1314670 RepID=A0A8E2EBL1_9PEZI|nr:hypothetical protein K432DRAFT_392724 [Lepidopterella palustris CBS 459.81]
MKWTWLKSGYMQREIGSGTHVAASAFLSEETWTTTRPYPFYQPFHPALNTSIRQKRTNPAIPKNQNATTNDHPKQRQAKMASNTLPANFGLSSLSASASATTSANKPEPERAAGAAAGAIEGASADDGASGAVAGWSTGRRVSRGAACEAECGSWFLFVRDCIFLGPVFSVCNSPILCIPSLHTISAVLSAVLLLTPSALPSPSPPSPLSPFPLPSASNTLSPQTPADPSARADATMKNLDEHVRQLMIELNRIDEQNMKKGAEWPKRSER